MSACSGFELVLMMLSSSISFAVIVDYLPFLLKELHRVCGVGGTAPRLADAQPVEWIIFSI